MRIEQLILHTGNLSSLKDFYKIKLGMNVTGETANSFTIQTSSTNIIFNLSTGLQNPFYHFAFNIPDNQFIEAKNWAKERVELISLNGEDEFDFKNWNAHSLYFYDLSGNIIELIARHNLKNSSVKKFTGKSLLNVSEIGFPVHNVKNFYDILKDNFNIPSFGGDMKTFTAVGDDEGLFIIVPGGRKWFPDCQDAQIFPLTAKIISNEDKDLSFEDLPYRIISVRER